MKRRTFLAASAGLLLGPRLFADETSRFQYCLLKVGKHWQERERALVKLSYEIRKRCNIPVETTAREILPNQISSVNSPFFIISGREAFPEPTVEHARMMRLVLGAGGILLFDDMSPEGDQAFYNSAVAYMQKVYPEMNGPAVIPNDHAVYQSYYLLKGARGRLNKKTYMEGWTRGHRTNAFFSHNDLLGAMEADKLGAWSHNMEIGGGFRRELCFRLGINMTYYALTLNYKKDRAFPPIIERRRRQ